MSYLKTFFHVLKNSFSSASYYGDVLKAPFSFSLKYFLFYSFLLSIIVTAVTSVKILIPLNEFLTRIPQVLVKVYPAELEVKINKGVVSTNVQEPYVIHLERVEKTFEELDKVQGARSDKIKNILVIDTNASVEDMKKYQTYALLTRSYLSYYKDNGRIETVSLEKINNVTINQNFVKGIVNKFLPFLKFLPLFLIPFLFAGSFIFLTITQLVYLVFSALVLYAVSRMIMYPLTYGRAYQIDLHLATIIAPFFLILSALNIHVQIPFLRLLLFTVIGWFILNKIKSAKA